MSDEAAPPASFVVVCVLVFGISVAATVYFCRSMAGGVEMPGGWQLSMIWMRMAGQSWTGAAAMFLLMWLPMMIAMMLPSLVPVLRPYQNAAAREGSTRLGLETALVAAGYFFVWTMFGAVAFPAGAALALIEMRQVPLARAVPAAAGLIVVIAGAVQFTRWKAARLASCREAHKACSVLTATRGRAWRHGLRLGLDCAYCCAGFMVVLLVIGVMDLRAIAAVTLGISAERMLPNGEQVARAVGCVVVVGGLLLIARATGLACSVG